jgi:hypothetical protein
MPTHTKGPPLCRTTPVQDITTPDYYKANQPNLPTLNPLKPSSNTTPSHTSTLP